MCLTSVEFETGASLQRRVCRLCLLTLISLRVKPVDQTRLNHCITSYFLCAVGLCVMCESAPWSCPRCTELRLGFLQHLLLFVQHESSVHLNHLLQLSNRSHTSQNLSERSINSVTESIHIQTCVDQMIFTLTLLQEPLENESWSSEGKIRILCWFTADSSFSVLMGTLHISFTELLLLFQLLTYWSHIYNKSLQSKLSIIFHCFQTTSDHIFQNS